MNIFKKFALSSSSIFIPLISLSFLPAFYVPVLDKNQNNPPNYQNMNVFAFDYSKANNQMSIFYSNDVFFKTILDKVGYKDSTAYTNTPGGDHQVTIAINDWASGLISEDEVKNAFFEIDAVNKDFNSREVLGIFPITYDFNMATPKYKVFKREITSNRNDFDIEIKLDLSEPRLPTVSPSPSSSQTPSFNFISVNKLGDYEDFQQRLIVNPNRQPTSTSGFGFKVGVSESFEQYFSPDLSDHGDALTPATISIFNNAKVSTNIWGIFIGIGFLCLIFIGFSPALIFILKKF